jgi:hypothetical protein
VFSDRGCREQEYLHWDSCAGVCRTENSGADAGIGYTVYANPVTADRLDRARTGKTVLVSVSLSDALDEATLETPVIHAGAYQSAFFYTEGGFIKAGAHPPEHGSGTFPAYPPYRPLTG